MGLDPVIAVGLRIGEGAAAELAAIPDLDALRTTDEAVTRKHQENNREAGASFKAKIERIAAMYLDGSQPNFASASVAELLAFCVAIEKLAWGIGSPISRRDPICFLLKTTLACAWRVPRVPKLFPEDIGWASAA